MKIKTKSRDKLIEEGWKRSKDSFFLGDTVGSARYSIGLYAYQYALGKECIIEEDMGTRNHKEPHFKVKFSDEDSSVILPWLIFEGGYPQGIKSFMSKYYKSKKFPSGEVVYLKHLDLFKFECGLSRLSRKEAQLISKWILSLK